MEAQSIGKLVCDKCPFRFQCYTQRECCQLTTDVFMNFTPEQREEMHILKAKKQGHYYPKRAE